MATSRGATPADPTLVATTDDAARGGLFARSNTGGLAGQSPATTTDTHVSAVDFNETTRVLTVTLTDGTTFTPTIPGGTSGPVTPGTDTYISAVAFNNDVLTLTYNDPARSPLSITIPAAGVTEARVQELINTAISRLSFFNLTDVVEQNFDNATAGQVVRVNGTADGLEFGTPSSITQNDFVDNQAMIFSNATDGSGRIAARVAPMDVSTALPGGGSLRLVVNTQGLFSLSTTTAPPTPPTPMGRISNPPGSNILTTPPDQTTTITVDDVTNIGTPTVTVRDPAGDPITIDPNNDVNVTQPNNQNMGTVMVTVPGTDVSTPGTYTVDTMIPVTDTDNMMMTLDEMSSFEQRVPAVTSRSPLTTASELAAGTHTDENFDPAAGITITEAGDRSSTIYIAIAQRHLTVPGNRAFADVNMFPFTLRKVTPTPISVMAGTETVLYDVFTVRAAMGATINNFRLTQ